MKSLLKHIYILFLGISVLLIGCTTPDIEMPAGWDDTVPEGYVRLDINLAAVTGKAFLTRSGEADPLLSRIDDVHVLIFQDTNQNDSIEDDEPLVIRNFYEYGVMQNIYLKRGPTYYIYAISNLDDSNCLGSDVDTYFDDVTTYGELKNKYVQFMERTPRQLNKMIMATKEIVPVSLPENSNIFKPTITMHRLYSKFIINIYNKVTSATDQTVTSGVYPSRISFVDLPRYSFIHERKVNRGENGEKHDYAFTLEDASKGYFESMSKALTEVDTVVQINGNWYTRQTLEYFAFENRRGDKNVTDVHDRKELAPDYASYLQLVSLTTKKALLTFIHPGKGRESETATQENIGNYDIDRSCVYHVNVYINGVNNIEYDSRRAYLDQVVIFSLPDVRRIDAHYMDIPAYILGTMKGYAKLQSGTCDVDANGEIIYGDSLKPMNWQPMTDTQEDDVRWLRFSWGDPYKPTASRPINTSLYVNMTTVDGVTGATPILHFNEFADGQQATVPAVNPNKRTAAIRIGFVLGATSNAEYDQGVEGGRESAFYVPISQYGMKTIGQMGGYKDGLYTSLLGVESVEEYTMRYYTQGTTHLDVINKGPIWRYRTGFTNHNQPHDGKQATTDHYNEYRGVFDNGVPPKRWDAISGGVYNPVSNTNAADYCMRKNRDEDGNGIIEGDEIKWYLPTPAQLMQIYIWRNAFKGGSYSLNLDYVPFGNGLNSSSSYYWTTNEEDASGYANAYVVDFTSNVAQVAARPKTERNPVRCVRDIPGTGGSGGTGGDMIYYTNDGHLAVDLTNNFPSVDGSKVGKEESILANPGYNTLGAKFLISRWYVTNNSNHTGVPSYVNGNKGSCSAYQEEGYSAGSWRLPSQVELSFIYAYSGMLETILKKIPGTPDTSETYHTFRMAPHWAVTDMGNNSSYWRVDFATGSAGIYKKSQYQGYFRCVTYVTDLPPAAGTTTP